MTLVLSSAVTQVITGVPEMRVFFCVAVCALGLAACGESAVETVLNTPAPLKHSEMDQNFENQVIGKLPKDDQSLFFEYVVRKSREADNIESTGIAAGTTVGMVLDIQKRLQATVSAAKAPSGDGSPLPKVPQSELKELVTVKLEKVDFHVRAPTSEQIFDLTFTNNTQKDVAGIEGMLKFVDLFGNDIDSINIRMTETINKGETNFWVGSRLFNPLSPAHLQVTQYKTGKFSTVFFTQQVVFSDGTRLISH